MIQAVCFEMLFSVGFLIDRGLCAGSVVLEVFEGRSSGRQVGLQL
jgi:hypothetical protein